MRIPRGARVVGWVRHPKDVKRGDPPELWTLNRLPVIHFGGTNVEVLWDGLAARFLPRCWRSLPGAEEAASGET